MPATTKLTHYDNGIAQFTFEGIPSSTGTGIGTHVVTGLDASADRLLLVLGITHSSGTPSAVVDYTSECSISADNQLTNTTTSFSNLLLRVTVARKKSG